MRIRSALLLSIGLTVKERVAAFAGQLGVVSGWRAYPPERLLFAVERSIADRRLPANPGHQLLTDEVRSGAYPAAEIRGKSSFSRFALKYA